MDLYSSMQGDGRPSMSLADMIGEDNLNKSFNSAISAASVGSTTGSSSSKAVLAALRALQDKIRRLETERSQALDEASQLRMQLKNQEIEHEHSKQREHLASQKTLQEARNAYERATGEKQELELRVAKMDEKNRSLQAQSEDLQFRIRQLEEDKHNGGNRLRDLETHQGVLEQQIRLAQQREKDAAETILWEGRKHEDELRALQQRMRHLQLELSEASAAKGAQDTKVVELDGLVAQLLSLNEALVAQLSGRPIKLLSSSVASASKKKKTKRAAVLDKPPRAASVSTAASEAAKTSKFSTRSPAQLVPVKTDDVDQLKAMHKMFASAARSMRKGSPKRASSMAVGSPKKVPTRMASKKASSASSSSSSALGASALSEHGYVDGYSYRDHADHQPLPPSPPTSPSRREVRLPRPALSADASESYLQAGAAASPSPSRPFSGSHSGSGKDLQVVIHTLEEEFDSLNRQYRRLLSGVQASNHVNDGEIANAERIQTQAEEIVSVIQRLHQKGEQLRMLKSPR